MKKVSYEGKVNEIADELAKAYWNERSQFPPPKTQRFGDEGWSISMGGLKQERWDRQFFYDYTFGGSYSREYWNRRHNITNADQLVINWPALGYALKGWPWGKKKWLSKHMAGFSATGRVMLRRDEWVHSKCPHCDQPNEDAVHVLTCSKARKKYLSLLDENLLPQLEEADTDPDITRVIMSRLRYWFTPFRAKFRYASPKIRLALQQ